MSNLTMELVGSTEAPDKGIIREESEQIKEKEKEKDKEKDTKYPLLSPQVRKQEMKDALRKTRNASMENFMKFQWSWSI